MPSRCHAIILWTLQRTGGSNLTVHLKAPARPDEVEHEPFDCDRTFSELLADWDVKRGSVKLADRVREICEKSPVIKCCVELVPEEVTRALVEAASRAGFKHLFLYPKASLTSLLSLHFERQAGVCHAQGTTTAPLDALLGVPLPVHELLAHEKQCAQRLRETWELLLSLEQAPQALTYEEVDGEQDPAKIKALIEPVLTRLGLADCPAVVNRLVSHVKTRGDLPSSDLYSRLPGIHELERGLARIPPFIPAPQLMQWETSRPGQEESWVRYATLDAGDVLRPWGGPSNLAGLVIITTKAPRDGRLFLRQGEHETPVPWGFASQWAKQTFPNAPNADRARFTLKGVDLTGAVQLDLVDPANGIRQTVLHLKPQRPSREVLIEAALRVAKESSLPARSAAGLIQYQGLRRALDTFSGNLDDLDWLRASVLLDARFQQAADTALEHVSSLRKALEAQEEGRSEPFLTELRQVLGEMTLGPHGYTKALAGRDAAAVWSGIQWLLGQLEGLGATCFINSGTLLGAVREGRLIAHDDDVDLAVILDATNAKEAASAWLALKGKLAQARLLDLAFDREVRSHAKIGHAGGASVDLFPAWLEEGRVFVWPYAAGDVAVDALLPLRPLSIGGVQVTVPNDPAAVLAINYGEGWRRPDPSFRFDWSYARTRFKPFLNTLSNLISTANP